MIVFSRILKAFRHSNKLALKIFSPSAQMNCTATAESISSNNSPMSSFLSSSSNLSNLTNNEIDTYLSQNAYIQTVNKDYISDFHVNTFAANEPIEDRYAVNAGESSQDFYFGVFDGHGGFAAAEFAKQQLISYVQYNLSLKLQQQASFIKNDKEMESFVQKFSTLNDWDQFELQQSNSINTKESIEAIRDIFDSSRTVPDALKKAFQQADQAFLLSGVLDKVNKLQDVFSGACLLLSYIIDNWIFVANAGDCKAVLGKRITNEKGEKTWIAVPLSTMHTAKAEQELIQKEHPNEPDAVFQGRVKGFLEPSRGLGDALFKDKYFNKCLLPEAQIPEPFSPPYTTVIPDIEMYQIDPQEDKDHFLILASDGLWDMISDQQAVEAVVESIKNNENASTALLKKAIESTTFEGNNLYEKVNYSLRLTSRIRRHFYDDTTSIVVFFKPNPNPNTNTNSSNNIRPIDALPRIPYQPESPPASFVQITEQLHDYLPPNNSAPT